METGRETKNSLKTELHYNCYCLFFSFPELTFQNEMKAHPTECICIKFDLQNYFAIGSDDSMVSLWDAYELCCVRMFTR